jgi:RNA polymerase sigma-70 factor (ECF subfamily)
MDERTITVAPPPSTAGPLRRAHALVHCSDETLVARTARGDEEAFAELYDRLGGLAYSLAFRVLRSTTLAEDAVQEAFLGVWRTADRFDARRASARAWLLLQVRARAIDRVRHEQRRATVAVEPEELESSPAPDDVWRRLERERLDAALATLPDRDRELLELAYFEGYTQSELARRLGMPLGTVKRRTFDALGRLRAHLGDDR